MVETGLTRRVKNSAELKVPHFTRFTACQIGEESTASLETSLRLDFGVSPNCASRLRK
jgi:hypothetical protein